MISKENLDKRICDCEEEAENTQTYREWVRVAEEEFGLEKADIDNMNQEQLIKYDDWLEYLYTK